MAAAKLFIAFLLSLGLAHADETEPTIPLYQYKPIYFLLGKPYTKVQFGFKAPMIQGVPLYFGYTQLMMWHIAVRSPYFYDINYNPEIFYRIAIGEGSTQWIDLGPFEHESNGTGGERERSWNRSSIRYHSQYRLGERARLSVEVKAWIPWILKEKNSEITRYRGSGEVTLILSDFLGRFFEVGDLIFRLYPGGASTVNPLQGGQELTFRCRTGFHAVLPLFVGQVFHGVGESLYDLTESRWGLRAGFGF